ncbi:HalOD1 output domain-containing protein [Halobaculum sp. EA56]|uniref:HalOD1 output domain-containing protein n=1 Tax=Halobaculum sp. EA56 TaxID=3421648 RepID=UPI003EB91D69
MSDRPGEGSDRTTRWGDRVWALAARRRHGSDGTVAVGVAGSVMRAVADASGVDPHDLTDPVLYDHVDVDALERLVERPAGPGDATGGVSVRFRYDAYLVAVHPDGLVEVYEPLDRSAS